MKLLGLPIRIMNLRNLPITYINSKKFCAINYMSSYNTYQFYFNKEDNWLTTFRNREAKTYFK